ncbi:MAG: pentapeptide repeat-containing protein, partial [Phenylobacterium sp.]|nr:pentapeptide repeat-containing protein [Phenylobacterium sp.]
NAWINRGRVVWPWADLRGCDLSGADLSGAYLHGAKIDFGGRTFTLKEADQ